MSSAVVVRRPRARKVPNCGFGLVQLRFESGRGGWAALGVPCRRRGCLGYGLFEVLNVEGHAASPREYVGGPPPKTPSWRCLRRPARVGLEFLRTTPPQRPGRLRDRGSGSTRRRAQHALRQRAEGPQRAVAANPLLKISTFCRAGKLPWLTSGFSRGGS